MCVCGIHSYHVVMCIALHLCCRLHPVPRVPSRCPFRVPELPHVSVTSRRPTLLFGRLTLPVCREVVVCVVVLLCATRLSNLVAVGLRLLSHQLFVWVQSAFTLCPRNIPPTAHYLLLGPSKLPPRSDPSDRDRRAPNTPKSPQTLKKLLYNRPYVYFWHL